MANSYDLIVIGTDFSRLDGGLPVPRGQMARRGGRSFTLRRHLRFARLPSEKDSRGSPV